MQAHRDSRTSSTDLESFRFDCAVATVGSVGGAFVFAILEAGPFALHVFQRWGFASCIAVRFAIAATMLVGMALGASLSLYVVSTARDRFRRKVL